MKDDNFPPLEDRFLPPEGWQWDYFSRKEGRSLRYGYVVPEGAKGVLVMLTGVNDIIEKYFETIHWALDQGLGVFALDWYGQGGSGRYLDNVNKRHSDEFDEDVKDCLQWMDDVVLPLSKNVPLFLYGHSMGGNLAFRVAYERPQIFKALITSVPMFGVKALRYIPACMVKAVHKFMPEHYVPGGVDWNEMQHLPPKLSILTKDKVRNPIEKIWLNHDANLRIGAITYGWLYEAWQSCQAVFALDVSQFDMPCLIFEAQHEHLVDNKAIDKMTARLPNVEKVFLKGSYHEPFLERDYIRDIMLNKMKEFITRYLPV